MSQQLQQVQHATMVVTLLSTQAGHVMDVIQRMGDVIPHGTPLGDQMLQLMDVVIGMDDTIDQTQRAIAFIGRKVVPGVRSRHTRALAEEERAELLQARADRREWARKEEEWRRKLADAEHKLASVQELNTMLMERHRPTTPSSGFCSSAAHSPRSMDEPQLKQPEATTPIKAAAASAAIIGAAVADAGRSGAEPMREDASKMPPRKPSRTHLAELEYTPEFEGATFADSIQFHCKNSVPIVSPAVRKLKADQDGTIHLSDSLEEPNEGPLCSTFRDNGDRSIYHTPVTSKKMRRRSSSLGDVMKKIFTPKQKVKNPILEIMED